jgi:NitT/TauT family transport system substrate-binding protein
MLMKRVMYKTLILVTLLYPIILQTVPAQTLRVGVISQSVNKWPMWVAEDKGFFKDQGLDVEVILTGEASPQIARLKNSDLDITHQAADHIIRAVERGENFVLIHTITRATTDLLVGPGIKNYADLKGKTFALSNLNVAYWLLFNKVLQKQGVYPGDYTILDNTGGPQARMQVLRENRAQVTYMNPPSSIEAEAEGYTRLTSIADHYPGFPASSIATRPDWAEQNRDTLVAYLRAYILATEWLRDPENYDEAINIAVKIGGHNREILPSGYDTFVNHGMVRFGTLSPDGYNQISELLMETGIISEISKMEKYADPSFQQQALQDLKLP